MNYKTVRVTGGRVRGCQFTGWKGKKYYSFTKIPYAECPYGNMRFTESNAETMEWPDVLDCSTPVESLCDPSEGDLLFVNIFTPEMPRYTYVPSQKAVMVFIPSGGNYISEHNLSTALYGPDYLVAEDVVVVVVSYRSGGLGFLSVPDLQVGGDMGMIDLISALSWIKQNISLFNGDPKNVTVFAQGTGATVIQHMFSFFSSKDLYDKLILQHGASDWNVVGFCDVISYAKAFGLRDNADDGQALRFLRALRYEKIVAHEKTLSARYLEAFTTVEYDVYCHTKVPLIVGYNKNVFAIHRHDKESMTFLKFRQQLRMNMLQCFKQDVPQPLLDIINEEGSKMPIIEMEMATCLGSRKTGPSSPVYLYHFDVEGEFNVVKKSKKITEPG